MEGLSAALQLLVTGPILPATLLVGGLAFISLLTLLGTLDLDLLSVDGGAANGAGFDASVDVPETPLSLVGIAARWLNFGRVPVFIWTGIFAVLWWLIAILLWIAYDASRFEPTILQSILLAARNGVIAVGLTKLITQPLGDWFAGTDYSAQGLMGQTCEISTSEATPEFGQAHYKTEGAPLLLNVRTDGPPIPKGASARIIGFDPTKRIYTVTTVTDEVKS